MNRFFLQAPKCGVLSDDETEIAPTLTCIKDMEHMLNSYLNLVYEVKLTSILVSKKGYPQETLKCTSWYRIVETYAL